MCRDMDRQKEAVATASDHHEQTVNSAQTESTPHSDIDSITENTSDSAVSSLYDAALPSIQIGTATDDALDGTLHPLTTTPVQLQL